MGNAPSLRDIYREHGTFVWRVVCRLGVPSSAVDDAVQEVFVVLHRRRDELDFSGSIRGLLYGVARKVAKRQRDKATVAGPSLRVVDSDARPDPEPDMEHRVELEQKADVVRRALDAMDEDKRLAFVMVDVEGMSVPEVAASTGINLNTVYARVRAARKLMAKAIERHRAREEGQRVRAQG